VSLRFRRSVRLAPGVRLNFGLRGPSISVGPRGLGATIGPAGLTTHIGAPGTGLSYRTTTSPSRLRGALSTSELPAGARPVGDDRFAVGIQIELDEHGRVTLAAADGSPLDPRVERRVREEGSDRLRAWLIAKRDEINNGFDTLLTIHVGTPRPDQEHRLAPEPLAEQKPEEPPPPGRSAWDTVFPWRRRSREEAFEHDRILYQHDLERWEAARATHQQDWEQRRKRTEDDRRTSPEVMHDLLEEALNAIAWPRETLVRFEIDSTLARLHAEIDLPEIEDLPTQHAEIAARGLKLNLHDRTALHIREAYVTYAHGAVFRVVGEALASLPTLLHVTCSGFSQRVDPATGHVRDDFLLSARVPRGAWGQIDFTNLAQVDPVAALGQFELRTDCNGLGRMVAITPFEG
jgi:hypothetical protein